MLDVKYSTKFSTYFNVKISQNPLVSQSAHTFNHHFVLLHTYH